jgi:hypothetical protein
MISKLMAAKAPDVDLSFAPHSPTLSRALEFLSPPA